MLGKRAKDVHRCLKNIESFSAGQASVTDWDGDMLRWMKICLKPNGGPYRGGRFMFEVNFGKHYPKAPPIVSCLTWIYHPNIDSTCEEYNVCLSVLDEWDEVCGLEDLIQGLLYLFYQPNLSDPLSPLFEGQIDYKSFVLNVRRSLQGKPVMGFRAEKMIEDEEEEDTVAEIIKEAGEVNTVVESDVTMDGMVEGIVQSVLDRLGEDTTTEEESIADDMADEIANAMATTMADEVANNVANSIAKSVANSLANTAANAAANTVENTAATTAANTAANTVANTVANTLADTAKDPEKCKDASRTETYAFHQDIQDCMSEILNTVETIRSSDGYEDSDTHMDWDSSYRAWFEAPSDRFDKDLSGWEQTSMSSMRLQERDKPPPEAFDKDYSDWDLVFRAKSLSSSSKPQETEELVCGEAFDKDAETNCEACCGGCEEAVSLSKSQDHDEAISDMCEILSCRISDLAGSDTKLLDSDTSEECWAEDEASDLEGGRASQRESQRGSQRGSRRARRSPVTTDTEMKDNEANVRQKERTSEELEIAGLDSVLDSIEGAVGGTRSDHPTDSPRRRPSTEEIIRVTKVLDELLQRARQESTEIEARIESRSIFRERHREGRRARSEAEDPVDVLGSLATRHGMESNRTRRLLTEIQTAINYVLPSSETQQDSPESSVEPTEINTIPIVRDTGTGRGNSEERVIPNNPDLRQSPIPIPQILEQVEGMIRNVELNGEPEDAVSDTDSFFTDDSFEGYMARPTFRESVQSIEAADRAVEEAQQYRQRREMQMLRNSLICLAASSASIFFRLVDVTALLALR